MIFTDDTPLAAAEIASSERWDRCMAAAREIDVHGDPDPYRVAWALSVIATETAKDARRLAERAELIPAQGEAA